LSHYQDSINSIDLPQAGTDQSRPPRPLKRHTYLVTNKLRINKFFTHHGICSRREADRLIESGRVTINQRVARLGDQVGPDDVIERDGQVIPWGTASLYIKYYKPVGVTTTSESHVPRNIIEVIGQQNRI